MPKEENTNSHAHPGRETVEPTRRAQARRVEASEGAMHNEGPALATAAVVGVGLAIVQPELIPGMLIGVGATLAPRLLPAIGNMFRPMMKGIVRTGYGVVNSVREAAAEAGEEVQDMVAEARAEQELAHGRTSEGSRAERANRPKPHTHAA